MSTLRDRLVARRLLNATRAEISRVDTPTRLLTIALNVSTSRAVAIIVAGLALSWGLLGVLGGGGKVPPHWFYLVILYAGARFHRAGAIVAGTAAGLLAGPLSSTALAGTTQPVSDWLTRTVFFVSIGWAAVAILERSNRAVAAELHREMFAEEIHQAIANNEFHLDYQPIVDLADGRIIGAEALLRWRHPRRGLVPPDEFIPLAEDTGLIHEIGHWVIERAARTSRAWNAALEPAEPIFVAVNVSPRQLTDGRIVEQLRHALAADAYRPLALHVEVTEGCMIDDHDLAILRLSTLRELGIRTVLDDFGTGHAGLSHLHVLPIDTIKIDRSFVLGVAENERSREITRTAVALAQNLGLQVIAEGVETVEQATALRDLRCPLAQGFHFSRPIPEARFEALLANQALARECPNRTPDTPKRVTDRVPESARARSAGQTDPPPTSGYDVSYSPRPRRDGTA